MQTEVLLPYSSERCHNFCKLSYFAAIFSHQLCCVTVYTDQYVTETLLFERYSKNHGQQNSVRPPKPCSSNHPRT